jgi:hypothetical protein
MMWPETTSARATAKATGSVQARRQAGGVDEGPQGMGDGRFAERAETE